MRSNSISWLFSLIGINNVVLEGGYKSYRRKIKEDFGIKQNYLILSGNTGSNKTIILEEMQRRGSFILNLEKLANHRGSSFGSVNLSPVK
jgi:tRNA 2-selenouridine synthase